MRAMEVHLAPDVEKQLNELAAQSGRAADELLQDALPATSRELVHTREMLDRRYDDLKSGAVEVPSPEKKSKPTFATRALPPAAPGNPVMSGFAFHPSSARDLDEIWESSQRWQRRQQPTASSKKSWRLFASVVPLSPRGHRAARPHLDGPSLPRSCANF